MLRGKPIFEPALAAIERSQLTAFMVNCSRKHRADCTTPQAFHRWSCENTELFWSEWLQHSGLVVEGCAHTIYLAGEHFYSGRWFPALSLNYAENLLANGHPDALAIVALNERGERREETYQSLRNKAGCVAKHLRDVGVNATSVVAGVLPNTAEAVIAALGAAWLGSTWTSASPDFGLESLVDRFGQSKPVVLFAVSGYQYQGKCFDIREKIRGLMQRLTSCQLVWCDEVEPQGRECLLREWLLQPFTDAPSFVRVPFNHPLFILYSSGTTGLPKCMVHGVGGTLIQHAKEHRLHTDITPDDKVTYYTTCGWMMWNWLISVLATGARLILYDGAPMFGHALRMMEIIENESISVFGTSAKYLEALANHNEKPNTRFNLTSLRTILSTGSPLSAHLFEYCIHSIRSPVQVASISGGTDIISCFILGHLHLPVYAGEIQAPGLGMDVDVFDETGASCRGVRGELVCKRPFPSMPLKFLDDKNGDRYRAAYFERFSGVWTHGDFAEISEHGGYVIHGRSDTILNPGGVRIGTAEIYRHLEAIPELGDLAAVAYPVGHDVAVVLFVQLRAPARLTRALIDSIKHRLKTQGSPRHVPQLIVEVDDIPKTRNGKISEMAVRQAILDESILNLNALLNPDSLTPLRERFKQAWKLREGDVT